MAWPSGVVVVAACSLPWVLKTKGLVEVGSCRCSVAC